MSDTVSSGRATIQYFQTPHPTPDLDPEPALLALINAAKTSIECGIYSITLATVADALVAKHQAGVTVRMVVDATEASSATSQVPALIAAGIDLRTWGSEYHLAHFKTVVVDGEHCALGSFNWSSEAELDDLEVMVTATDKSLAANLITLIQTGYNAGTTPTETT